MPNTHSTRLVSRALLATSYLILAAGAQPIAAGGWQLLTMMLVRAMMMLPMPARRLVLRALLRLQLATSYG